MTQQLPRLGTLWSLWLHLPHFLFSIFFHPFPFFFLKIRCTSEPSFKFLCQKLFPYKCSWHILCKILPISHNSHKSFFVTLKFLACWFWVIFYVFWRFYESHIYHTLFIFIILYFLSLSSKAAELLHLLYSLLNSSVIVVVFGLVEAEYILLN